MIKTRPKRDLVGLTADISLRISAISTARGRVARSHCVNSSVTDGPWPVECGRAPEAGTGYQSETVGSAGLHHLPRRRKEIQSLKRHLSVHSRRTNAAINGD